MRAHGTRSCYVFGPEPGGDCSKGCRCEDCKRANARYASFQQKRRRLDRDDGRFARPYIDARRARAHLQALAATGVGRRRVAALTGMSQSVLGRIRSGSISRVRRTTEATILAVKPDQRAGAALVEAGPTWHLIEELLAAGVTRKRIGQAVTGNPGALALQLRHDYVLQRSAERVAALHLDVVLGGREPEPGTAEHFRWWRARQARLRAREARSA